ncbi:acetylcholine receptor subunit alpha-L1-like [Adelges cooleyi]|uniref:acetylcholine receptor subunit alpha-L1-like n=1 Tax=Adelges cooleyi TaxID=133065 RepID=UPI00218044ED|nr:acetylcholine receptor subunit alpha-L1-like [Adelges cooleyi]
MIFYSLLFLLGGCLCNPDAKRLYDDLLSNYNRLVRPVSNNTDTVLVKLGLRLSQLIELNLKDQILTTNVWLEHEWVDHKFRWNPLQYGGVQELYVPSEHIWLPDIVLYNNGDGEYVVTTMTKAVLHYSGKVLWTPPAIFKSSCEIDVRYFPFDQQTCFMKFGSWTYDGNQIDLQHMSQTPDSAKVNLGIDLRAYYPSVEWDILAVPAERHEKYYSCCKEPYVDIFFNITLRRRTLFYTVNLIVPCVGISYLSVLVFYLPADSKEKISLCITILLSQTMFFLLISEIIPSTSVSLPLLGKYLLFTMLLVALCVVVTIVIINIHYRQPSTHKMTSRTRTIFIKILPKLLLIQVPVQLLADSDLKQKQMKSCKKSNLNLTKLNAASVGTPINVQPTTPVSPIIRPASPIIRPASPIIRPESPIIRRQCTGCTDCQGSAKMAEDAASRLADTADTAVPSIEDTLNQTPDYVKKKYPLELIKAIHHMTFIQKHVQRQDEFNTEDKDWGFVAMVLDRLFLWLFILASILGTVMILFEAPALYDDTKPIDREISFIAKKQFAPTVN